MGSVCGEPGPGLGASGSHGESQAGPCWEHCPSGIKPLASQSIKPLRGWVPYSSISQGETEVRSGDVTQPRSGVADPGRGQPGFRVGLPCAWLLPPGKGQGQGRALPTLDSANPHSPCHCTSSFPQGPAPAVEQLSWTEWFPLTWHLLEASGLLGGIPALLSILVWEDSALTHLANLSSPDPVPQS